MDREIGESLATPTMFKSCRRHHMRYLMIEVRVRLFREPDALTAPVRFDEREQETEPRQAGLRQRGRKPRYAPPED